MSRIKKTHSLRQATSDDQDGHSNYVISFSHAVGDVAGFVQTDLSAGQYTTLTSLMALLHKARARLVALSRTKGVVVLDREQSKSLILSMAFVKEREGELLGADHSFEALLKLDAKELRTGVIEAKKILKRISEEGLDFENVQRSINTSRNPSITKLAMAAVGPHAPTLQTSIGPLDLSTPHQVPKELPSDVSLDVLGQVVGGLQEASGVFDFRVISSQQTEFSLLRAGMRYQVRMLNAAHRTPVLLAQLLELKLRVRLQADRVPFLSSNSQELKLILVEVLTPIEEATLTLGRLAEQIQQRIDLDAKEDERAGATLQKR